ncbi:MAG: hypothetical protein U0984_05135 [Prosthecobacter sp.]|nr:hypothetical protein [Prosthecobacter sp.]
MKSLRTMMIWGLMGGAMLLVAQETTLKAVKELTERGTLSDQRQIVRGDTGKWNDAAKLQHAPPIEKKPQGMSLDDWADLLEEEKFTTTATDDNWLIFRTRQLDDNDRVWVERIERRGNEFTILLNEAIWQGRYNKTFTYYEVAAVNLGKLPPGNYSVKWQVKPLTFKQIEKPPQPNRDTKENWPTDEQPATGKPVELRATFSVR